MNHKYTVYIAIILIIITSVFIVFYYTQNNSRDIQEVSRTHGIELDETLPRFENYPAEVIFKGKPAPPVNFDSYPIARTFKTAISQGASTGPNFAGHYTVVTWGCGTQCQMSAIIDAYTGNIVAYGIPSGLDVSYSLTSNLFIVNAKIDERMIREGSGPITSTDFYVFEQKEDGHISMRLIGKNYFFDQKYQPIDCVHHEVPATSVITKETDLVSGCIPAYGWVVPY